MGGRGSTQLELEYARHTALCTRQTRSRLNGAVLSEIRVPLEALGMPEDAQEIAAALPCCCFQSGSRSIEVITASHIPSLGNRYTRSA